MNNWQEVWERLPLEKRGQHLDKITGFDSVCKGDNDLTNFKYKIHKLLVKEIGNAKVKNICEMGCGCGNNLIPFNNEGYTCFGVDYSKGMINKAKEILPKYANNFYCDSVTKTPINDNTMDFTFSYSVFQYLDGRKEAKKVIDEMIRITKVSGIICIWDIPDKNFEKEANMLRDNKDILYAHQFYSMSFFSNYLKEKNIDNFKIEYYKISEYLNSRFRFNLTFKKEK